MATKSVIEKLWEVNPEAEIWWDSSPLIFDNWRTKMIQQASDKKQMTEWMDRMYHKNNKPGDNLFRGVTTWQGEAEGTPDYYTIADGYLYVWNLIDSTHQGENIYMDYYTDIVEVDSDADEITLTRHDMVKHWLKWQIRNITERNGQRDMKDGDWIMFTVMLEDAKRRESSGQKFKQHVKVNGITYRNETNETFDTA